MPELPEVEIVRRGLEPVMLGQSIALVDQRRPDLRFPFPANFAARLEGQSITAVKRRAKYLVIDLSGDEALVIHLGMSGRLTVERPSGKPMPNVGDYVYATGGTSKHDHVVFTMGHDDTITYNDPRRFGFMLLMAKSELDRHPLFAKLGVEPLGMALTVDYLASRAADRRVDLKAFLLDQHVIAGLGNIYVCEALHRAGLSPKRQAQTLAGRTAPTRRRTAQLQSTIQAVLEQAIVAGGSSLRDYRHADGTRGEFQNAFTVYGRAGQPCTKVGCGGTITRITQAQRSTYYCPDCQN
jgi:formamidopyrimidine-DNA glycosylase